MAVLNGVRHKVSGLFLARAHKGCGTLCQLRLKVLDGVCCMLHPAGGQEEHGREKYAAAGRRQTPPGRWMYHPHEYPTFLFV